MTQQPSARHRAFGFRPDSSDGNEPSELEPITFDVGPETNIRCVENVDGFQLLVFTAVMGPGNSGTARSKAMIDFIQKVIIPEDYQRFLDGCAKGGIDIETVGEICGWLADEYSERPTRPAQPSSAGQPNDGSPSADSSSSAESTGDGSTPPTS